jgi:excisionase family DNA binding protein
MVATTASPGAKRSIEDKPKSQVPHPPDRDAKFLTAGNAAWEFGCGMSLVHELIRSGELPSIKVGGRRLIPKSEFDSYVARKLA